MIGGLNHLTHDRSPSGYSRRHMAINLRAPFFVMKAAAGDMLSRQAPGSIVD